MSALSAAFYTALSNDVTLTNGLSTWDGRPAIFTYEPVPKDVELPYVITAGEIADEPNDSKNSTGRRIIRDIRVYSSLSGSTAAIESLAERIRTLFHRSSISITGFKTVYVNVSGPRIADEQDVYGRILSVELLLSDTQ